MTSHKKKKIAPGLLQLETNKFEVRVRVTCPRTGKRLAARRIFEGTRKEAFEHKEEVRQELLDDATGVLERKTLEQYAKSWMTTSLAKNRFFQSTAERYTYAFEHILPDLGQTYLDELRRSDVEEWLVKKARQNAPSTCNGWLRLLRTVLNDAVADQLAPMNVAAHVATVKEEQTDPDDPDDYNALTPEELRAAFQKCKELYPQHYALLLALSMTGARWGEVTALKWSDVEQAKTTGVIWLRRSHWRGRVKRTKTRKSRMLPYPNILAEALREHRERLEMEQNPGLKEDWVFPSRAGTLLANGRLSKPWKRIRTKAGINRRVTIHGLRRTMTDLLRQAEVDAVTASALIGHDTERMRRHYSSVRAPEARAASDRVLRLVIGGGEDDSNSNDKEEENPDGSENGSAASSGEKKTG